jgi:organic radical activating enzyme
MYLDTRSRACSIKGQEKVFNLYINRVNSCCRAYPEPLSDLDSVSQLIVKWDLEKKSLEQGEQISGCDHCWRHEKQGIQSYRQQLGSSDHPNHVELIFSNACNQMCSYCSPKYSTTWQESIRTQGLFERVSGSTNANLAIAQRHDLDAEKWLGEIQNYILSCEDNSVLLTLLGGEPLMQQAYLEKFLQLQNPKIQQLGIVTNLNPPSNKFLIWLLDHYDVSKLRFSISLDATPGFNHVPRAGFDQIKFHQNLDLLKHHGVDFEFMPVVSALSIFDLCNFLHWIQRNNFCAPDFFRINNPAMLDPVVVPLEFRTQILESTDPNLLPENVRNILSEPDSSIDLKLFEQYNYLEQYFARTGIDPNRITNDLFVQYWNWLKRKFT